MSWGVPLITLTLDLKSVIISFKLVTDLRVNVSIEGVNKRNMKYESFIRDR